MGISMRVDGSAASCRASARAVRQLALSMEQCGTGLGNVRTAALGAWAGQTADLLDVKTRRMVGSVDVLVPGLRTFARELDTQADAIATTNQEMRRARAIATKAGITVPGDAFPSYGEVELTPAQEGPRDHGELIIGRARSAQDAADEALSAAAATVLSLAWETAPAPSGGTPGLQGPLDFLPDLPDLPDLSDLADLAPHVPGLPMPMPDLGDLKGLSSTVLSLVPLAIRKRGDIAGEIGSHSKTLGRQLKGGALDAAKAGFDQWTRDMLDPDMEMHERLGRAATRAGLNLGGGMLGAWACAQAVVTTPLIPGCAVVGTKAGDSVADHFLEDSDGR